MDTSYEVREVELDVIMDGQLPKGWTMIGNPKHLIKFYQGDIEVDELMRRALIRTPHHVKDPKKALEALRDHLRKKNGD